MKTRLLLLFILLFAIPGVSPAAVTHTLEIEFAFTPSDDPAKEITGYNVYKEGEEVTCENESDPTASSVTCNFYSPDGTFNFTLTASYSDGTESPPSPSFPFTIDTTTVTPPDDPPEAEISPKTISGTAPLTVNFSGADSTGDNLTYSWDFGDGDSGSGPNISHIYDLPGSYTAELTVTNGNGSDTASAAITVNQPVDPPPSNQQPIAVISVDPVQCQLPLSVSFDGSHSSDPDGSITRYDWNFGDGATKAGSQVRHTFADPATYIVSLTVTDNEGATATAKKTVSCKPAPPEPVARNRPPIYLQMVYNLIYLKR